MIKPKKIAQQSNYKSVDAPEKQIQKSFLTPVKALRKNVLEYNENSNDVRSRFLAEDSAGIDVEIEQKAGTLSEEERLAG